MDRLSIFNNSIHNFNEFIINKHPINIEKNNDFDSYHYFHFNHSSLINKISNKLKKYSNLISK